MVTATNVVTQTNDQGQEVTSAQPVGVVTLTATAEQEGQQSTSRHKSRCVALRPKLMDPVTSTDPAATETSDALVVVTRTLSQMTTDAEGQQSVVIAVSLVPPLILSMNNHGG